MSSFEDFENTQKEMYEEIIEILKEDSDLGQYTDQILDPIGYQAEYIRHQQQKIDELEDENELLYRERNGCKADLVKTKLINIKKEKIIKILKESVKSVAMKHKNIEEINTWSEDDLLMVCIDDTEIAREALAAVKEIENG